MELIIALVIIIAVPVIFSIKVNKMDVPSYETLFCKGAARASEGMTIGALSVEHLRMKLLRRNSKF